MIVTLDGHRVEPAIATTDTLQTLLDRMHTPETTDRLIVSVRLDGRPLSATELNTALAAPLAGCTQVDLASGDRSQLVRDVLRGLADEFGESTERFGPIADALAAGDVGEAMRQVGEFVELWQTCYRGLSECCGLLGRDLTQCRHDGEPVQAALESLVEKLKAVRDALETGDLVLLGDLVRYELPPLAEEWSRLLADLARQVATDSAPRGASSARAARA